MFPSTFQVYILLRQALDVISQGRKVISKLSLKYIFLSHETLDQVLSITYIYIYIYMIYQFGVRALSLGTEPFFSSSSFLHITLILYSLDIMFKAQG